MPVPIRMARPAPAAALVAFAFAFAFAFAWSPRVAFAGIPIPGCATVPAHINLVGASPSGVDPLGEFAVEVRNFFTCDPLPGSIVDVEFPAGGDLRLATGPLQPGAIVDCPRRTIRGVADISGIARFRIVGGSAAGPPSSFAPEVRIYADGVLLASFHAAAFDLDGVGGVGGADLALWLDDFGSTSNPPRSDYDGNGLLGGADLAVWLDVYGAAGSTQSGPAYCP